MVAEGVVVGRLLVVVAQAQPGGRLDPLYDRLGVSPPYLVDVVIGLAIIVASWIVGKWIVRWIGRPVARRFERPSLTRAALQGIRVAVIVVALIIAATIIGFSPGEILLSVTVFSAVLAVVLAPIVRRFIGGIFVLADQPYEIGDMIALVDTDTRGFVEDVTLRYTKMFTLDNTFIVIPNSEIINRDIINYSAEDKRIRQTLVLVVTYEGELDRAREIAVEAAADVDDVISRGPSIRIGSTRYPAEPRCYIDEFGDHGVRLILRFWVREPFRLPRVRSQVQQNVWDALAEAPVEIAYPHSHLVFDDASGELPISLREPEEAGWPSTDDER